VNHRSKSRQHKQVQQNVSGNVAQDLVSFYFTNVSDDISYKSLRQGFEVYGMMEDVLFG